MINSAEILQAKVLVVDDLPANVRLLERVLGKEGYVSVASTLDPRTVCELHRKNRYDLILLDINMPGMDGFEVMQGLKGIEEGDGLPVLVVSAQPDHWLRALRAGARDFVTKPFEISHLLGRVHDLLEARLDSNRLGQALSAAL
jgi:DNA-binding response OmpR family regulator